MTRKEQIRSAYKLTGGHAGFYDGMMTYSTLPAKAICRIVWNMDAAYGGDHDAANGVDIKTVSGMLGHYDAGFTLRTYTHTTNRQQAEAADMMGSLAAQSL